ncbi:uncharacterized protein [Lolium perenne]|uniref:uncharacterized protein n=1 Tax=Lolium perenne TaxID=4522 RepID=UPI0021E9F7A5|nr:uncharacterized protein LOC127298886 [Lolium perenne]
MFIASDLRSWASKALFSVTSEDRDDAKATPATAEAASPATAAPWSVSRPRAAVQSAAPCSATRSGYRPRATHPSAAPFSPAGSRSRPRPAVPGSALFSASRSRSRLRPDLHADVDYSKHDANMMKKLRHVPEEEWFPRQRQERRLTGGKFWTVVQKDLYLAIKKKLSEMAWIDWALVGPDVRGYFAATPGLDGLLERRDLRWADSHVWQFYATLWVQPDRSRITFMLGNERRELTRDDFAKYLGLAQGGARVHSLACPNGSREEDHLPPLESIRHLYKNPDAVVVEHCKDRNQLNHEAALVYEIVRKSIRPISGHETLTTIEIWILHLLMSAKPVDVVDLMIGVMQEIILDIKRRLLPYAPYLIHLFDKKGWLEHGMKIDFGQRLKRYPNPDSKRRLKKHVKSPKAPKPKATRSVGTRSVSPQVEAGFDRENTQLDHTLSPSLEEDALGKNTNREDNLQMVPFSVPNEFRFSQQGVHDAEAGRSGGHANDDDSPMLQSHVDRQPANLEQIQGQHQRDPQQRQSESHHQQLQGQLAELQRQCESDRHQIQEQLAELQRQRESDRHQIQEQRESDCQQIREHHERELQQVRGQHERDLQQIQRQLAELQRQSKSDRQENRDLRKQLAELQRQSESNHQENRDIRKQLAELQRQSESDRQENRDLRKQYSDIAALLNKELEELDDICRL